jgi:hypothetical protein
MGDGGTWLQRRRRAKAEALAKSYPEWDEGLVSWRTKNRLIAELVELIRDPAVNARRDELLRRAAIELDPDAFPAFNRMNAEVDVKSVLDEAIAEWKATDRRSPA